MEPEITQIATTGGIGDATSMKVKLVRKRYPINPLTPIIASMPVNMKMFPIEAAAPNLWAFLMTSANPYQADLKNQLFVRAIWMYAVFEMNLTHLSINHKR